MWGIGREKRTTPLGEVRRGQFSLYQVPLQRVQVKEQKKSYLTFDGHHGIRAIAA